MRKIKKIMMVAMSMILVAGMVIDRKSTRLNSSH